MCFRGGRVRQEHDCQTDEVSHHFIATLCPLAISAQISAAIFHLALYSSSWIYER